MKKNLYIALALSLLYFSAGFLTLKNYNISWDEPTHFKRGQAYLWYFLTGRENYWGLPEYNLKAAQSDPSYHLRSIYQSDQHNFPFWLTKAGGDHPPLNGILAAFTNYIFFQKLGWVGDIESYHLFEVVISSALVAIIFLFAARSFGVWAGIYAAIFIATFPLFWAESHFNIKDPVETTFFTAAAFSLWRGLTLNKLSSLLWAALWISLAFSTKFNAIFLPIIIICWLFVRQVILRLSISRILFSRHTLISFFVFPVLILIILFAFWPYLWQDPWSNLISVFRYYREMGTEESFRTHFIFGNWNSYAIKWVIYTTPPILLLSALAGFLSIISWTKEKKDVLLLWVVWLVITVLRVSLPNMSIYGGVRQIMEYIPPLALLGGVGFFYLQTRLLQINVFKSISRKYCYCLMLIFLLIINVGLIWRWHPNENVYFNFLISGLRGAVASGLPSAGSSFGNAYLQGLDWFNKNAPLNSKLAMVQALTWNIPAYKIRPDIQYSNYYWSGINRKGEYLIELTFNYEVRVYLYCWEYVEKMLNPVYEVKVGNTPILKIWKNDFEHTKPEFQKQEAIYPAGFKTKIEGKFLKIELPEKVLLSRLLVDYSSIDDCIPLKGGYVYTSLDNQRWQREGDSLLLNQLGSKYEIAENSFRYMFAARETQYIEIETDSINSCLLKQPKTELVILQ